MTFTIVNNVQTFVLNWFLKSAFGNPEKKREKKLRVEMGKMQKAQH